MYENILVPINEGKRTNIKSIREAEKILSDKGMIHALYVDDDSIVSSSEGDAMENLEEKLGQKKDYDYAVRRVVGSTVDEIIEYNNRMPIDLIVMYTYDKSSLQELVEGSVTESVIDRTDTPVLVLSDKLE